MVTANPDRLPWARSGELRRVSLCGMAALASLVADRTDRALEAAIFETSDPDLVAATLTSFVEARLGAIEQIWFYRGGTGIVIGLRVAGAGDVVIKIHRRNIDTSSLRAAQQIQRHLFASGYPAPRPLLGPTPIADGIATAEELIAGDQVNGHDPTIRTEVAVRLHEFITLATPASTDALSALGLMSPTRLSGLWGDPHDVRFDFDATLAGAEWIDGIAVDAQRQIRAATIPEVVAHFDWRVENLAVRGHEMIGVFDWDSVGRAPESVAVGQSSAQFSTDWTIGHSTLPDIEEMAAFVTDYESARGSRFTNEERRVVESANLMVLAYCARCEHSDRILHPELAPSMHTWAELLTHRSTHKLPW